MMQSYQSLLKGPKKHQHCLLGRKCLMNKQKSPKKKKKNSHAEVVHLGATYSELLHYERNKQGCPMENNQGRPLRKSGQGGTFKKWHLSGDLDVNEVAMPSAEGGAFCADLTASAKTYTEGRCLKLEVCRPYSHAQMQKTKF